MSEQHSINLPAHHNIYTRSSNRELRIDFSTPQNGVNESTGLLILVPGFGANIESKVYRKMRGVFADKFNLVTIQCAYFGSSYMQSTNSFKLKDAKILKQLLTSNEMEKVTNDASILESILAQKKAILPVLANLEESIEEFNDMGYMQAIDIISAVKTTEVLLKENGLTFNSNRIIGYGHSHGAYLLHLSNRLAPNLFSYIIDNSAWMEPVYLSQNRVFNQYLGKATLAIEFDYLAKQIINKRRDLNLEVLYKGFKPNTQILSFQGDEDNLINHLEKKRLIENINNAEFLLIKKEDVDNIKYKSNTHGLNADFLELFSFAMQKERLIAEMPEGDMKYTVEFENTLINVDFTQGLPVFNFDFK